MSVKKYFAEQFQVSSFSMQHEFASDFYICCWQRNRAVLPFLCLRVLLFLWCVGILLASITITVKNVAFGFWLIYLTHWGIILITTTTGFAVAVSARAYLKGPIEGTFGLPWYVQAYWMLLNTTVPVAFFITVFYFLFLHSLEGVDFDLALPPALDYSVHLTNSIIMLVLLAFSRHPFRILHFYYPLAAAFVYMLFSFIYYQAGGLDSWGRRYIYPMVDWSRPGPTLLTMLGCAVALVLVHCLVAALAAARDALARTYTRSSQSVFIINN